MDANWAKVMLDAVALLVSLWALWVASRRAARDDVNRRIQELSDKVDALGERVSRAEERISAAPTHDDLGKVYRRLEDISSVLHQLVGEQKATNTTLRIVTEHMVATGRQG